MSRRYPRRWVEIVVAGLVMSLGVIVVPFAFHITGLAGGALAGAGFIGLFVCYFTLWGDVVSRVAWRLETTTIPKPRQDTLLLLVHIALAVVSGAVMLALVSHSGQS
jgi:hypothetical protein